MNIKLVIFDLAGTTISHNSEVHNALIDAFESEGIEISFEEANDAMGIAKPVAIKQILEGKGLSADEGLIASIHDFFVDGINEYYSLNDEVLEQPGTTEIFKWLHANDVKIGLDTGFDRETTNSALSRMGWTEKGLIDVSVCSDEVKNGRPHPDMIIKAMRELDLENPREVMKVGDTPVDLEEGANADCGYVVGVLNGTHTRDQLVNYPHTHLIEDLLGIKEILQNDLVGNK